MVERENGVKLCATAHQGHWEEHSSCGAEGMALQGDGPKNGHRQGSPITLA